MGQITFLNLNNQQSSFYPFIIFRLYPKLNLNTSGSWCSNPRWNPSSSWPFNSPSSSPVSWPTGKASPKAFSPLWVNCSKTTGTELNLTRVGTNASIITQIENLNLGPRQSWHEGYMLNFSSKGPQGLTMLNDDFAFLKIPRETSFNIVSCISTGG